MKKAIQTLILFSTPIALGLMAKSPEPLARLRAPSQDSRPTVVVQDKSNKESKIRRLLTISGADKTGTRLMKLMLSQFSRMKGLPEGFAREFMKLADPSDLAKRLIPIYEKHISEKDLDAILAFYHSESGKRWLAAQPKIAAESQQIGMSWGKDLARKTMEKLKKGN